MKKNMGSADKIIRILVAIAIAVLYYMEMITGTLGTVLLVVGAVFLLTSFMGSCPLYSLLGIKTCPMKEKE